MEPERFDAALAGLAEQYPDPHQLANRLVLDGWLTAFQTARLLEGKGRELRPRALPSAGTARRRRHGRSQARHARPDHRLEVIGKQHLTNAGRMLGRRRRTAAARRLLATMEFMEAWTSIRCWTRAAVAGLRLPCAKPCSACTTPTNTAWFTAMSSRPTCSSSRRKEGTKHGPSPATLLGPRDGLLRRRDDQAARPRHGPAVVLIPARSARADHPRRRAGRRSRNSRAIRTTLTHGPTSTALAARHSTCSPAVRRSPSSPASTSSVSGIDVAWSHALLEPACRRQHGRTRGPADGQATGRSLPVSPPKPHMLWRIYPGRLRGAGRPGPTVPRGSRGHRDAHGGNAPAIQQSRTILAAYEAGDAAAYAAPHPVCLLAAAYRHAVAKWR